MLAGRAKEGSPAEILLDSRVEGLFAYITHSKLVRVWSQPSKDACMIFCNQPVHSSAKGVPTLGNTHQ